MTYAIVEECGYENERIIGTYESFGKACRALAQYNWAEIDELHVRIMKVLPEGTLTAEF